MEWFDSKLEKRFPTNATEAREITVDNPGWILSTEVRYDREKGILELSQSKAIPKQAPAEASPSRSKTIPKQIPKRDRLPDLTFWDLLRF